MGPDRAVTPERKREVLAAVLEAWLSQPSMRLTQLIVNAIRCHAPEIFYTEDYELVRLLSGKERPAEVARLPESRL